MVLRHCKDLTDFFVELALMNEFTSSDMKMVCKWVWLGTVGLHPFTVRLQGCNSAGF